MAVAKQWLADTFGKLKKDKKAFLTVTIGIVGMLLVLLSELPLLSSDGSKKTETEGTSYYNRSIEEDTERLISEIRGVGKVSVMLTYESSEETVWAKDSEEKNGRDGDGTYNEKHIIVDDGDAETGLAVRVMYPRVRGVAVVCSGGDDPTVKSEIKSLISALFDIGSNRISIAPRAAEE